MLGDGCYQLSTPNQNDELPLHVIPDTIDPDVLQWILDVQFEDNTLLKFNMIAARNKFGISKWTTFGATKPLQDFFGSKLIEYMTELDFAEVDMITIKEIFRFTLKWKNPEIQKLILEKVD